MAEITYIKVFVDYLDAIEPLGDAERGRLFTSLLTYARSGEVPQLNGNERFLFPMMRAQIDRDVLSKSRARMWQGSLTVHICGSPATGRQITLGRAIKCPTKRYLM